MRLLIILIFITMELVGCGGVGSGREERRFRDDYDRRGNVPDEELDEYISDSIGGVSAVLKNIDNYLKNCQSAIPNIPRTELDVVFGAVGVSKFNKFAQARECLEQRLQEVTVQICQSKEDIYTQSQQYRNFDNRAARVQNGVDRIEELHRRHQDWLLDQADRFHDRADKHADSSLLGNEYRAYADIFESEAFHSCAYGDRFRRGGRSSYRNSGYGSYGGYGGRY
ncbi:MAG: hypothetical protein OXK80_05465 [Bdellovibrionales bacterium]|nr:hypothetical protein [Bdellovibrionales bacterium]